MALLSFREGDFWCDVADEINLIITRWQEAHHDSSPEASKDRPCEVEQAAV